MDGRDGIEASCDANGLLCAGTNTSRIQASTSPGGAHVKDGVCQISAGRPFCFCHMTRRPTQAGLPYHISCMTLTPA